METMPLDTTCPCCGHRFPVEEDAFPEVSYWAQLVNPPSAEVECPACEWVFAIDAEGEVVDEGELDPAGLFAVDDDGEWVAEELVRVTCPHCHNTHEADGSGVTTCPYCKHTLDVDERGRALNARVSPIPECPRCEVPLEEEEWGMSCPVCRRKFQPDREPDE